MASQFQFARHVTARNTILLWLSGAMLIAGVVVLVAYHALRDESAQAAPPSPLMSTRNATAPLRNPQGVRPAARVTDSTADVARAHDTAVASAVKAPAPSPPPVEPAKRP